jgi:hypothetical protein
MIFMEVKERVRPAAPAGRKLEMFEVSVHQNGHRVRSDPSLKRQKDHRKTSRIQYLPPPHHPPFKQPQNAAPGMTILGTMIPFFGFMSIFLQFSYYNSRYSEKFKN